MVIELLPLWETYITTLKASFEGISQIKNDKNFKDMNGNYPKSYL